MTYHSEMDIFLTIYFLFNTAGNTLSTECHAVLHWMSDEADDTTAYKRKGSSFAGQADGPIQGRGINLLVKGRIWSEG
jgi:hypothetical protein